MKIWITNEEGLIINTQTGDCYTREELEKLVIAKQIDNFSELNDILAQIKTTPKFELKIIRGVTRKCMVAKKGYDFNKYFRVEMRKLAMSDLSLDAHGVINKISQFIVYPMNAVIINYEHPKMEDIRKIVGVGENKFNKIMRELEDNDVIHRCKIGREVTIYFNPFLINCGLVHEDTLKMFEFSEFNPYKDLDFDNTPSK